MTPFIAIISYILVFQCILILYMAVPWRVPFRRTIIEKFTTSNFGLLNKIRFAYGVLQVFIALLFCDNIRNLKNCNEQVDRAYKSSTSQDVIAEATKRLHKTQRDFYILAFTLYCGIVVYLLHLVVLRSGRYRKERNGLRETVARLEKENKTMSNYITKVTGEAYVPPKEEPEDANTKSKQSKKKD
ncbi:hypothetical protein H8356DRAFT_1713101 [Neocallimastix lanati (nom. inval.)]|jgi:hypothetical protein|uniref:Endoplasmic reticulum transmembrane protein n=1 Tax=Neocallimastix californiae TaxID=1754190 RepID=A0A1Y2F031_9FUNG|nr:hypothetical protein H8356DRAFT_1713101 [Neocallimastix sp. JGI-2020a]ORY76726.1 hypothetical protein LY90DRAFT_665451 [Neocallimastix californiae]|eukprot:ORY76726.1 hypothetical protein LY90DRAFT_665451 [Neocallimastix californiae]